MSYPDTYEETFNEESFKNRQIVKSPIVMPAVSTDEAVKAWHAYQDLSAKILTKDDIQVIQGKDFKKKSYWRKCQRFFNLSLELKDERKEMIGDEFIYHFTFRATAPNGTYCDGTGSCSSKEKGLIKTAHNTRAIAETRAKNRAISDLVAFGEVSAEEVDQGDSYKKKVEPEKKIQNGKAASTTQEAQFSSQTNGGKSGEVITEKQRKRLYAISKSKGLDDDQLKAIVLDCGYTHGKDIKRDDYDRVVSAVENAIVDEGEQEPLPF